MKTKLASLAALLALASAHADLITLDFNGAFAGGQGFDLTLNYNTTGFPDRNPDDPNAAYYNNAWVGGISPLNMQLSFAGNTYDSANGQGLVRGAGTLNLPDIDGFSAASDGANGTFFWLAFWDFTGTALNSDALPVSFTPSAWSLGTFDYRLTGGEILRGKINLRAFVFADAHTPTVPDGGSTLAMAGAMMFLMARAAAITNRKLNPLKLV